MLHSRVPPICSSYSPTHNPSIQSHPSSSSPPVLLRFRTSHRENLRYLRSIGIINPATRSPKNPSPESLLRILSILDFFKSKGFSDSHVARLAFVCPQLFSPDSNPADIQPVFDFLQNEVSASAQESCGLILRCPHILQSNVEFCLKPTLLYLRELGVEKLNVPSTLNAHLLNTRIEKLVEKVQFLQGLGLSYGESSKVCARFPALFGYSVENNLLPKFEYLVEDMERELEELLAFPQYFAFSLEKRIVPRHLHLKQRNIKVPLKRMLMWSDQRFYAKWK